MRKRTKKVERESPNNKVASICQRVKLKVNFVEYSNNVYYISVCDLASVQKSQLFLESQEILFVRHTY